MFSNTIKSLYLLTFQPLFLSNIYYMVSYLALFGLKKFLSRRRQYGIMCFDNIINNTTNSRKNVLICVVIAYLLHDVIHWITATSYNDCLFSIQAVSKIFCFTNAKNKRQINCTADQRLCFTSLIVYFHLLLNLKFQSSSLLLRLYKSVCVHLVGTWKTHFH